MPQVKLTSAFVAKANAIEGQERTIFWDTEQRRFGLLVTGKGARSYVVQYRAAGISRRMTINATLPLDKARKRARALLGAVAQGRDPLGERQQAEAETKNTLQAVAEEYLAREGKQMRLRSLDQRQDALERLVYPTLGRRPIAGIKRSELVRLLDRVEDENGPAMAQAVLATLRRLFSWHASRDDDFLSPIVRGMSRVNPKDRARKRVLSDAELRAVWRAAEGQGTAYGHLLRFSSC